MKNKIVIQPNEKYEYLVAYIIGNCGGFGTCEISSNVKPSKLNISNWAEETINTINKLFFTDSEQKCKTILSFSELEK